MIIDDHCYATEVNILLMAAQLQYHGVITGHSIGYPRYETMDLEVLGGLGDVRGVPRGPLGRQELPGLV